MTETLESAQFTRDQSDAFIQSVALAMETFAVTPKVLDDRMDKLRGEWKQDMTDLKQETNHRFDGVDKRLDEIPKLREAIYELQRSQLRYFLGFTFVMFAGLMGILGTVLSS